jgi:hypothetical protein
MAWDNHRAATGSGYCQVAAIFLGRRVEIQKLDVSFEQKGDEGSSAQVLTR